MKKYICLALIIVLSSCGYHLEVSPRESSEEYCRTIKSKNKEQYYNSTEYFFLYDDGELESVNMETYMSYAEGDIVCQ